MAITVAGSVRGAGGKSMTCAGPLASAIQACNSLSLSRRSSVG